MLGATFEAVYADILNLGKILNREARAEALVAEMRQQEVGLCHEIETPGDPTRVFVFDAEIGGGAFTCGQSLENHMIRVAGGINLFGDRQRQFTMVSWQEIAAADPQVILVHRFFDGNDGERKVRLLQGRPELTQTSALRHGSVHVLGIKQVFPGLSNVHTALDMLQWFNVANKN